MSQTTMDVLLWAFLVGIGLLIGLSVWVAVRAIFSTGMKRKVLGIASWGVLVGAGCFAGILATTISMTAVVSWVGKTYESWFDARPEMKFAFGFAQIAVMIGLLISLFVGIKLNDYIMERLKRGLTPEEQEVWQREYADWPGWAKKLKERFAR